MWKSKATAPVWEFLGWTFLLVGISYAFRISLDAIGVSSMAAGAIISTVADTFVGTFSPMYGAFIVLMRHKCISGPKQFILLTLESENKIKTIATTAVFCIAMLCVAAIVGTRTEMPLYLFIPAVPLMVLGGGLEEVGWRGYLQPALEKRVPFVVATLITAAFWLLWHLPLWWISSSNQSSYHILPYTLQLIVNAFVLAAIYRLTKSTIACVFFHAWGNAIGAVYQWELFATYPIPAPLLIYYIAAIIASIGICTMQHAHTQL